MSIIVVQVGQCGNQLGEAFWRLLRERLKVSFGDAPASAGSPGNRTKARLAPSPFFSPVNGFARCVLVDSEPKVVRGVVARCPAIFRRESAVVANSGRGNNWAAGYCGFAEAAERAAWNANPSRPFRVEKDQRDRDNSLLTRALRAVHEEASHVADGGLEAIVVFHSMGGGTGSGFGCRLLEKLRKYFAMDSALRAGGRNADAGSPAATGEADEAEERLVFEGLMGTPARALHVISVCIAPGSQLRDTNVESINATLTLASLLSSVDAILLLRNDEDHVLAAESLKPPRSSSSSTSTHPSSGAAGTFNNPPPNQQERFASFEETNERLASMLVTVFGGGERWGCVSELVSSCAPDPRRGLLTVVPASLRSFARYYRGAIAGGLALASPARPGAGPSRPVRLGTLGSGNDAWKLFHPRWPQKDLPLLFAARAPATAEPSAAKPAAARGVALGPRIQPIDVVILNQCAELSEALLFPTLRDCAMKVAAGAFVHQFRKAGLADGVLHASVARVAACAEGYYDVDA